MKVPRGNSTDITQGSGDYTVAVQTTIAVLVVLTAITSNGLLIFLFCRHKSLRQQLYSILIVDLSIIHLLSSTTKIPLFVCYSALDLQSLRGKTFAWSISFINSLFTVLCLSTVALQMTDRYLAICWPNFYKAKKSKTKMYVAILVKWILSVLTTGIVHIPLYTIDIGNQPVFQYGVFYTQEKAFDVIRLYIVCCFVLIIVLAFLALRKLKKRSREMVGLGQNPNSPTARLRRKAIHTLIIVTGLHILCNLPTIIILVARNVITVDRLEKPPQLIGFAVMMFMAIPSAADPLLFLWRNSDFKEKAKELKAVLCGQSTQGALQNPPEQIPVKQARGTHVKETNSHLTGRRASLPELLNLRQPVNTRRHSFQN